MGLRGYAPQGSDIPTAQAWPGTIPADEYGLEFETDVSTDRRSPPGVPIWRAGCPGVRAGSDERGPDADITIRITRVVLSTEVDT